MKRASAHIPIEQKPVSLKGSKTAVVSFLTLLLHIARSTASAQPLPILQRQNLQQPYDKPVENSDIFRLFNCVGLSLQLSLYSIATNTFH